MRLRETFIGLVLGSVLVLSFALFHLRSIQHRPTLLPGKVTDLSSLRTVLEEWERQENDQQEAQTLHRVAAELSRAIEADREAQLRAATPPPARGTGIVSQPTSEQDAFFALATAGTQCHVAHNTELWGDPVVWGVAHHANSAAECCAACSAHQAVAARGGFEKGPNSTICNTWVFCGDKDKCGGHYGECWLKRQAILPPADTIGLTPAGSIWTSGVVFPGDSWLQAYDQRNTLTMHLALGKIVVELLPALAPSSVRELRRLAVLLSKGNGRCDGCKLYRVETNFLVQGVIMHPGGYVATPRVPNPPQKKVMERGLVCWAGGAGGPDFFVNLIDQSGFGDSHLCWGLVKDMTLLDAIVKLPIKPKAKATDMTFLAEELQFNITLS